MSDTHTINNAPMWRRPVNVAASTRHGLDARTLRVTESDATTNDFV